MHEFDTIGIGKSKDQLSVLFQVLQCSVPNQRLDIIFCPNRPNAIFDWKFLDFVNNSLMSSSEV